MPRVQKDIRQEIASLRHNQYFLAFMVLLFVSIIVWTSVSIFTSQKETKVSPKLQQLAKPLTPTIKSEIISELEGKRAYSDEELAAFPIYKIIVSQDGRETKIIPIDTPADEIEEFRSVQRTPRATASPRPTTTQASPSATQTATGSSSLNSVGSSEDESNFIEGSL